MSNFVLVHGAWHGGWCWDRVARRLRDAGHQVLAPTMPGLAERSGELDRETGLNCFVDSIRDAILSWGRSQFTLVGHSFGGAVARGVHAELEERIGSLVLLDALNPGSGESPFDMLPDATVRQRRDVAVEQDGVSLIPVPPLAALGIEAADDIAWAAPLLTGHPLRSFEDKLKRAVKPRCPATYIVCTAPALPTLHASMERARGEGFEIIGLPANHEAMITAPKPLAALLDSLGCEVLDNAFHRDA